MEALCQERPRFRLDLRKLRKAPRRRLRVHHLSVDRHLKSASSRRYQLQRVHPFAHLRQEFRRRPDGPQQVVSGSAILDFDR